MAERLYCVVYTATMPGFLIFEVSTTSLLSLHGASEIGINDENFVLAVEEHSCAMLAKWGY